MYMFTEMLFKLRVITVHLAVLQLLFYYHITVNVEGIFTIK